MEPDLERVADAQAVLITGPTASGKSSLALVAADRIRGAGRQPVVVNADSMQVYDGLQILTARPGAADEARCAHLLYGHVNPSEAFSTGRWLSAVSEILERAPDDEVHLFVGGTGLYFKALTEGFAAIPEIPDSVRTRLRARLGELGAERLHAELARVDPDAAKQIGPGDSQRTVRALEVLEATGRPILEWQGERNQEPVIGDRTVTRLVVMPDRTELYGRIGQRFDAMIDAGLVDEVHSFLARGLDPALPAMKAIGVTEIGSYLKNGIGLDEAIARSKQRTRQYAKRQMTWMRNQMSGWPFWPGPV